MTQIKVETTIYYFNNKYNGRKESKKRNERVKRIKARENKNFFLFFRILLFKGWKAFHSVTKVFH